MMPRPQFVWSNREETGQCVANIQHFMALATINLRDAVIRIDS